MDCINRSTGNNSQLCLYLSDLLAKQPLWSSAKAPFAFSNSTQLISACTELRIKHLVFSKTNPDCFLKYWLCFSPSFSTLSQCPTKTSLFLHIHYTVLIFLWLLLSSSFLPTVPSSPQRKSWPHNDRKDRNTTTFDRMKDTEYLDYLFKNSSTPFLLWHINSEQIFNKAVILSINNVATNRDIDKWLLSFYTLIRNDALLKNNQQLFSQYPTVH